ESQEANLGFARLDLGRVKRRGRPETIFGEGKTVSHITELSRTLLEAGQTVLITRMDAESAAQVKTNLTTASGAGVPLAPERFEYFPAPRIGRIISHPAPQKAGTVAVLTGGTTDIPVAEEAALTAETFGSPVERIYDVGVAGLHRLLRRIPEIRKARVIIAVAGMEGALPSVVAGLVEVPVIAVPTSIGYGANFQGLSALLTMLNSCAPGIATMNINNGYGAGYLADIINGQSLHVAPSAHQTNALPQ
ncbi:MAG: nickel pincer cofactor biosynthesis protein LarB, partial [Candidatus Sumerlaeia bacterium]|nr:nickel pincer cofactor biosynthesis protein LarB [Candidatus Sumerlaeia bacterium]